MMDILTFSQCLTDLMQKYQLTVTSLGSRINARALLKRVLADDSTHARRYELLQKIRNAGLLTPADDQRLTFSLEVSRVGAEHYQFQQAIEMILSGCPADDAPVITTTSGCSLSQRLAGLKDAASIEILCINSCFQGVVAALAPLFDDDERKIHMKHLIHIDAYANTTASFFATVFPLLFDQRYDLLGMVRTAESPHSVGGNVLSIRADYGVRTEEIFFLISNQHFAHEMPNAEAAHMAAYMDGITNTIAPKPFSLKQIIGCEGDYPSLCMGYLSYELNRATYTITNDISFQQVPSDIAVAALREKAVFSEAQIEVLLQRTLPIHEQRYQNQYNKKKPTCRIMSIIGCERFLETGMSTDHFHGFRAFTPEERKRIFAEMLRKARSNTYFVPLLLKNQEQQYRYNLVCYEKLGISIDITDTDYSWQKVKRSIILTYPDFTRQYLSFFLQTLVEERCYSAAESLSMLEDLYQRFLKRFHLQDA